VPETREEVIRKASHFSQGAINLRPADDPSIYLDLAQAHYFLGDTEKAQAMLNQGIHGQNHKTRTSKALPNVSSNLSEGCEHGEM